MLLQILSYIVKISRANKTKKGKVKMKLKILSIILAFMLSISANAGEKITMILAGSPGGTFNAFNAELIKDLEEAGYDVDAQPGESMVKGGQIYSGLDKENVFVFLPSSQLNAEDDLVDREHTVNTTAQHNFMFGVVNYKSLCVKSGTDLNAVFNTGNALKIGMNEGERINDKYVERWNKVTESKNIMVPYNSSGKQIKGLITGDIDVTLVNEAKALRFSKEGIVTCNYTTNPNGGNGFDPLIAKINDSWFGWHYEYLLLGHLKNSDEEFSQRFHKVVTAIINDPTSNAGIKIAKNGWFAQDLSQEDLEKKYKEVYDATSKLLK